MKKNEMYESDLSLDTTCGDATDDVLREDEVHDDDREDREGDHDIDLSHVELQEVCGTKLRDQDRQSLLRVGMKDQGRLEVVVPAGNEGEDRLHGDGRLHQRKYDGVKDAELAGTVDAGRLDEGHRKYRVHVLLHIEEGDRRSDRRNDQRDEAVHQLQLRHELDEAECCNLRRDHHDHQDEGEHELLELEIICVDRIGGHGREVGAEHRT